MGVGGGGWDRQVVVDLYQGVDEGSGDGYYLIIVGFLLMLLPFVLSCPVFFTWQEHDGCLVCFFVYYFFSFLLVPLTRRYWCIEVVVSVM